MNWIYPATLEIDGSVIDMAVLFAGVEQDSVRFGRFEFQRHFRLGPDLFLLAGQTVVLESAEFDVAETCATTRADVKILCGSQQRKIW